MHACVCVCVCVLYDMEEGERSSQPEQRGEQDGEQGQEQGGGQGAGRVAQVASAEAHKHLPVVQLHIRAPKHSSVFLKVQLNTVQFSTRAFLEKAGKATGCGPFDSVLAVTTFRKW